MKAVHAATTEIEAVMLRGLLEDAGIPVVLRPHLVPGTHTRMPPRWGDLLVPDDRAADARAFIADYLASIDQGTRS